VLSAGEVANETCVLVVVTEEDCTDEKTKTCLGVGKFKFGWDLSQI